ncbi:unnamed protein product [Schistosoma guineensis]|nr:unnamed protein product [Schistosoma intercalatum]CAH8518929.1 unnamed protein product [Schistosoma guineensis]CAH8524536.1 unnamed protein product [Schistosoma curassoni]
MTLGILRMTQTASKPFLIGISGGAASGKAEACKKIKDVLYRKAKGKKVEVLSLSSFYRELSDEELKLALNSEFDFDHPNSFDFKYLADVLRKIKQGEHVVLHKYDCSAYSSTPDVQEVPDDVDVVIVEGILTFYQKEVRDMFDLKIFIESDADTRLCRKVLRDVSMKGRCLDSVLDSYFKYVKPAFEEFCLPTKKYADVILPRAPDNHVGVDLITEHLLQLVNDSPLIHNVQHYIPRARNQSESCVGSFRPH